MTARIKELADAKEGLQARGFFLVSELELRKTRQGKDYASLLLSDSTGTLAAKLWQERLPLLERGGIANGSRVMAEVKIRRFMGRADAEILFLRLVEEADRKDGYDESQVEPWARRNVEEMYAELLNLVNVIQNRALKDLVLGLLHRHAKKLKSHPAACRIHHAYRGGLLEHTLLVARSALALGTIYNGAYPQGVNRDVLLAGAILHDIGKLAEIDVSSAKEFTVEGNLVGHIVLGHAMIREAAREIADLDPLDLVHLEHLILSHQGRLEWGSPQEPKTAEAILLHYADDCDAKMSVFFAALAEDGSAGDFTSRHNSLGRRFYKKGGPEPPGPDEPKEQSELKI